MESTYTSRANDVLQAAAARAKKADRRQVTTDDLLFALFSMGPSVASLLLGKLGFAECGEEEKPPQPIVDNIEFDDACKRVLKLAEEEARAMDRDRVGVDNLALALLTTEGHRTFDSFIKAAGSGYGRLRDELNKYMHDEEAEAESETTSQASRGGASCEDVVMQIKQREDCRDMPLPCYMSDGASGMDLLAAVTEPLTVEPHAIKLVPTGISIAVPAGYEAQVRPRSGLALKHGITIVNSPGTIDSDYRGEIGVILANIGGAPFVIERNMRIAQLVVQPVVRVALKPTDELDTTARNGGGFGHTGV